MIARLADMHDRRSEQWLDAMLVECLAGKVSAASAELTSTGLWDRAACRACELGVGGVLDESLREQHVAIPASAVAILTAYRQHLASLNDYQLEHIGPALDALASAGVDFLLLKGSALNASLYQSNDVRGMSDVDLLIKPEEVERVDRVLKSAGCSRGADPVRADFFPRFYYEREYFTHGNPPVKLDVHVRPFRPLLYAHSVPCDALWDNPQRVNIHGTGVAIPRRENMLIHLCVHAACHGLGHLRWSYDIKKLITDEGSRMDWELVTRRALDWCVDYPTRLALAKVARTFTMNESYLHQAISRLRGRPGFKEWLAIWQSPRDADHPVAHVLTNLICLPGLRSRASYLLAVALPDRPHMAQSYRPRHPGWLAAAHATRFARGIVKAVSPNV